MSLETAPIIVLVDDEEDTASIFVRSLAKVGMQSRLVPLRDGQEAMTFFDRAASSGGGVNLPMVCFLDINMPGGPGGFDVLRSIRKNAALDRMPVVMLTSSDDSRDVSRASRLGSQCFLLKYPTPTVLNETIKHAVAYCAPKQPKALFSFSSNLLVGKSS